MIPKYYFQIICCPKCKSDLEVNHRNEEELMCSNCNRTYPVIEGIPILLDGAEDEVSQIIKRFYDSEWEKNENGILRAKAKHEDLSNLGQKYIQTNEDRFMHLFTKGKQNRDFFLDAASGAQPRINFGANYSYHVCLDFALDGLIECKRLLGDRAICICGSLFGELVFHPVQAIIDNDLSGMIGRFLQGVNVDGESLALDLIDEVGPIPGHYLDKEHTRVLWKKEHFVPKVSDRLSLQEWLTTGKKTALDNAKERMKEISDTHEPTRLSPGQEDDLERILEEAREYYRDKGMME